MLTSVRLTDSPKARSYNIVSEVEALARGEKQLQHTHHQSRGILGNG
jgi:hypothetical protein